MLQKYEKIFFKKYCSFQKLYYLCSGIFGVVVQLVRIPACHAGGRGFESRPYRKTKRHSSDNKKNGVFSLMFCTTIAPLGY